MEAKESPGPTLTAYAELKTIHEQFPHPVTDDQAIKKYPDGTEVIINSYQAPEYNGADSEIDTLFINVRSGSEGLSFVATEKGLVNVSIDRQRVSLRSILKPRPGENLRIKYNDPAVEEKQREALPAFREAASLLTQWIKNIDSSQQYTPPPFQ